MAARSLLEQARAEYDAAIDKHAAAIAALRSAEIAVDAASAEVGDAFRELGRAEARASASALEPGTRVHHRAWPELLGTVEPTDGSGLCIRQDSTGEVTGGFNADEWLPLEAAR